jgi:formiminotetrahydrofolate cyclodeaminase
VQSPVEKFLDDLASGQPTPGGGSAALKDRPFAEQALAEVQKLLAFGAAESEAVYALVRGKLG